MIPDQILRVGLGLTLGASTGANIYLYRKKDKEEEFHLEMQRLHHRRAERIHALVKDSNQSELMKEFLRPRKNLALFTSNDGMYSVLSGHEPYIVPTKTQEWADKSCFNHIDPKYHSEMNKIKNDFNNGSFIEKALEEEVSKIMKTSKI